MKPAIHALLLWLLPITVFAQMRICVEGAGIDNRSLEVGEPLYPSGISRKFAAYRNSPHRVTSVSDSLAS